MSTIVTDTCVVICFLKIRRGVELIASCSHDFIITDYVRNEITPKHKQQQKRLKAAIEQGVFRQVSINSKKERTIFERLTRFRYLGEGEGSAIAHAACNNGYIVATDDREAVAAGRKDGIKVITTVDLVVEMIRQGLLDVPAADAIKDEWEQHNDLVCRRMKSFADIV